LIKEGTICKVHGKEVSVEDLEEKFLKKGSFYLSIDVQTASGTF